MLKQEHKILIAGAQGMVGSALGRCFKTHGYCQLLTPTRSELDYLDSQAVRSYLTCHKPDVIVVAAAKVGGIWANMTYPADFIYNNLMIACNLIHEAHMTGISRLLFLASSCIYPRDAKSPILESDLLTGPLEKTNEAYAIAKIAGIKMCEHYRQQHQRSYISAMPCNLYGPNDNYHPNHSHVIPALLRRFHDAKINASEEVTIWGTGKALREFLYVDDLAEACLHLLRCYDGKEPVNVGAENDITILELAHTIAEIVGYKGKIVHDLTKPDGTPRKKMDITQLLSLGWRPKIALKDGLVKSYFDFLQKKTCNQS